MWPFKKKTETVQWKAYNINFDYTPSEQSTQEERIAYLERELVNMGERIRLLEKYLKISLVQSEKSYRRNKR